MSGPRELAVFGGAPAFRTPRHVGRPHVTGRDRWWRRVQDAFDRRWLTNDGALVQEFERAVAATAGTRHAVATCNATAALQVAARAAGLSGEVIVPSFTFAATAHAMDWIGLTPVFADCDLDSGTLDPATVEHLITPRTSGIVGVHLFGRPCDVDALGALARRHGLALLYDAAHAFGARVGSRPVGGFGDAEIFSFHATKLVHSFEGGALVTDDDRLAHRARCLRNFGFDDADDVREAGINAKMSEPTAAMGLTSLEEIDTLVADCEQRARTYDAALDGVAGVHVRDPGPGAVRGYLVIEVDAATTGIGADDLVAALRRENVLARRYFAPGCHRLEPYRSRPARHRPAPLPRTEALAERCVALPTGTAVSDAEAATVADLITRITEAGPAVTARLAREHPARAGFRPESMVS